MSQATQTCAACGERGLGHRLFDGVDRLHAVPGVFSVERCASCGSGTSRPAASAEEIASFYPSGYGPYALPRNRLLRAVSRGIRRLQSERALRGHPLGPARELPAGRAVDVGCGRGDLAATLVRRGWRVTGVEPSAAACEVARARGVDARQGILGEVELEPGAYDVAVFHHSLEHVTDPVADLRRVAFALRPGGIVSITVPNFGSWQSRRFRSRWFHLDLPRHRTHFTARGLTAALERAGFESVSIHTSSSSIGLPASAQYALVGRCLFPEGLPLRVAAGLCVLAFPMTVTLDAMAGAGDLLHAVARRPR